MRDPDRRTNVPASNSQTCCAATQRINPPSCRSSRPGRAPRYERDPGVPDGGPRWPCRDLHGVSAAHAGYHDPTSFFLVVKPLARLFRRLFLERLAAAFDQGELRFFGDLAALAPLRRPCRQPARINWVVYAEAVRRPRPGPRLSRPLHPSRRHRQQPSRSLRPAPRRLHLEGLPPQRRRHGHAVAPGEFIRRFLLHTLPDGFHRIRYFGFLANGHRAAKLALARALLKATSETEPRPLPDAPRTDPGEPDSGTGLLPRVFDGEAHIWPGVKDARLWEPVS